MTITNPALIPAAWATLMELADASASPRPEQVFVGATEQVQRLLRLSPFAAKMMAQQWDWIVSTFDRTAWQDPIDRHGLETLYASAQAVAESPEQALRWLRNRVMLRLIWRDFLRFCDAPETVAQVSLLADFCIQRALEVASNELSERFGAPIGKDSGEEQQLVILALGKLGAQELNLSSDIDLIFVYPEAGTTNSAAKTLSNQEFFLKLGQRVIALLDLVTADGFVFRVDMRLRPYGDSGPLVMNFAAFEAYYQEQGREWERYAMIKARPLTGRLESTQELTTMLTPFVFRRYIDFSVIDSLRDMKRMIADQVVRKGLQNDIKLGRGGIREIEFIAQCFQLIRGGRDEILRTRQLMVALDGCEALGCLPSLAVDQLRQAYWFLRNTEHALQGYQDKQTQQLPEDISAQDALTEIMGYSTYPEFLEALVDHRRRVSHHFDVLIADPDSSSEQPKLDLAWETLSIDEWQDLGFSEPETLPEVMAVLTRSSVVKALQAEPRRRLDVVMPRLISAVSRHSSPTQTLSRLLPLVEAVLRRSAYLLLLAENPAALEELVRLCGASPWIARQLALRPALLDELLDLDHLYTAPDKAVLAEELRQQMAYVAMTDLEAQMEGLRYFKSAQMLRIGASEIGGVLPLMQVSDKLTFVAEVILSHVLEVAWIDLVAKHGSPAGVGADKHFCIVAYGKLGGWELNYASDLDLVFLYDADPQGLTDGDRPIDHARFYTRLGQRIIHILETRMSMGRLYEVDMRLRPSGNSGLLVTTVAAFERYQRDSAWTWEHQALTRARVVAGDQAIADRFQAIRQAILSLPRQVDSLAQEVQQMRAKMRHQFDSTSAADVFDLKQDAGGIVDIEFMVQYAVLAWSSKREALSQWTDNVRQLETLAALGFISVETVQTLTSAYLAYRSATHECALQESAGSVSAAEWAELRHAVRREWDAWFNRIIEE